MAGPTAYTNYNGNNDPAGVPGTSTTESTLYNLQPDLSAIVVKMTPQKGKKGYKQPMFEPGTVGAVFGDQSHLTLPEQTVESDTEYKDWAEHDLVTYDRAVGRIGKMQWEERSRTQLQLWNAGLFKPTQTYVSGELDDNTQNAWRQLVDEAAKEETSVAEVLRSRTDAITKAGGPDAYYKKQKGSQRAPEVATLTNPIDVKYIADDVAKKRIGRSLTPEELDRFVSVYHGQEQAYASQRYAAGTPGTAGGEATQAASLESASRAFAEGTHPVEAAAQKQVDAFQAVADMFTKPTGPGTTGI